MRTSLTHHFATSFYYWFDHVLVSEGDAYVNKTGVLYSQTDPRLNDGYAIFASPYKQWVYDSNQTGANIPTGVTVNAVDYNRSDGVNFDFDNGRVIFTGGLQPNSASAVTCDYAVKELNVYLSQDSEEEVLMAASSFVNDVWGITPSTGVEPYKEAIPACFLNIQTNKNEPFALGGMDSTKMTVRTTVIATDIFILQGCLDLFVDKNQTIIPYINFTGDPRNEFRDIKTSPFTYSTFATDLDNGYFIDEVNTYKANQRINQAIGNHVAVGFIDFSLSQQRYPRI